MYKRICLVFSILFMSAVLNYLQAGESKILHEKTFKTEPGKELTISTSTGDIYITTWDKSEVYIKVTGNKKAHDKMKFKFENDDDGVKVLAKKDSWFNIFSFSGVYVKYEVKIPRKYNADLSTSGGDVKIYSLDGMAKVETSGGDIFMKNIKGKVLSSTSGGDITFDKVAGFMDMSTSGGDIKVIDSEGDVDCSTSGGNINVQVKNGRVEASTSGGDINLDYLENNKGVDLSTTGGDIHIRVPSNFAAYVDLSTTGGDVECDLPITSKGKFSSSSLKGNINGGGKTVQCSTTGGDIKVMQ